MYSDNTSVLRVQERVRKGGHHVPEGDIRRRFSRSLVNFWHIYRHIADHWMLFYNGESGIRNVAIGAAEVVEVYNEARFLQFFESAGIDVNE